MTDRTPACLTRLLVVDDDLIQRRLVAKIAAQVNHQVTEADSVAAAEAVLARAAQTGAPIDCVTVDLGLGDGLGADVLHLIADHCPQAQVLLVTGASGRPLQDTLQVARETRLEIHDVFIKPVDLVALRASLWRAREVLWAKRDAP
ncbi:response regulator [Rhodoblastus acidophilus]|uniref:Response regulator n=1 Tax=Rhodoblastus acidophilus TaxID=1074 RepID=A0A6N8DNZ8_RHOAC|nr:response regulator [Rhodoblastus acidophilus]MCW2273945.1 DNA-binding NtrC family response regulator [Rhodoblastus acidophilus]MTV30913.1 response regulator [Rhodoblastus acidophilus]